MIKIISGSSSFPIIPLLQGGGSLRLGLGVLWFSSGFRACAALCKIQIFLI